MKKIVFVLSIGVLLSSCGSGGCPCEADDVEVVALQRSRNLNDKQAIEECCESWEWAQKNH